MAQARISGNFESVPLARVVQTWNASVDGMVAGGDAGSEDIVFELWHKTTAGNSVSQGFMMRGAKEEALAASEAEYVVRSGAMFTLHLVAAGSYDGFPQPDLGAHNEVGPIDGDDGSPDVDG